MMVPGALASAPELTGIRSFLDVGTGIGLLAIAAARTWPDASVTGIDVWETGSTLQVTGRAQIGWDTGGSWPGAERLVVVTVDGVLERERVLPQHWNLIEPFGRNPPVNHDYSGGG